MNKSEFKGAMEVIEAIREAMEDEPGAVCKDWLANLLNCYEVYYREKKEQR